MKQKGIIKFLAVILAGCSFFTFAACERIPNVDSGTEGSFGDGDSVVTHEHVLIHHAPTVTCTEDGEIEHWSCAECNKNFSEPLGKNEIISTSAPALGHSYGEWSILNFATCNQDGEKKRICSRCGDEEFETIKELDHNFDADNKCTACGYREPTEGLTYEKIDGKEEYSVVGLGTAKDSKIVIAAKFKGLPVTAIGPRAFMNKDITSIYIPNGIKTIGGRAFKFCSRLEKISIPNTIEIIGSENEEGATDTFAGTDSLLFNVKDNVNYLGNDDNPYLVAMKATSKDITSATIDAKCKLLYNYSYGWGFDGCALLEDILIPSNTIKIISDSTFRGCVNLKKINLPEGITDIGTNAFKDCSNLKEIAFPKSLSEIACSAFDGCKISEIYFNGNIADWCNINFCSSKQSNAHISLIGPMHYQQGANLYIEGKLVTDLVIPEGVTEVSNYAFKGCNSLTSVTISDSVKTVGGYAFAYCKSLTRVTVGDGTEKLGSCSFRYSENITSVTVGKNLVEIGMNAFNMGSVESFVDYASTLFYQSKVSFNIKNGVKYLGNASNPYQIAVGYNSSLPTNVVIDQKCIAIACNAFGASSLSTISLPDTLRAIGAMAFANSKLSQFTFPKAVTAIENETFRGCRNLTYVNMPSTISTIGRYAFYNTGLKSLSLSNSVKIISEAAFSNCENLASVSIPNSVTLIGGNAFSCCKALKKITIPNSVVAINAKAFYDCPALVNVVFEVTEGWTATYNGNKVELSSLDLSNSATAAIYLRYIDTESYYCYYNWTRN